MSERIREVRKSTQLIRQPCPHRNVSFHSSMSSAYPKSRSRDNRFRRATQTSLSPVIPPALDPLGPEEHTAGKICFKYVFLKMQSNVGKYPSSPHMQGMSIN
ncbi:hypothetical protein XENOCAPTIV_002518 [Xenoophorus captivus]|uniref:Uncharacterized protein n=1 Tax=Xenoophorus captivus TaxID=1517983 RepID=A0ABV0RXM9_9TELE